MAKITVMLGDKTLGSYVMKASPFVCGREATNGIPIENVGVSRRHCQFVYDGEKFYVEDLGSSNGTHFQGQRVTRAEVRNGDQINVGKYVLMFEDLGMEMLPQIAGSPGQGPASAGPRPTTARQGPAPGRLPGGPATGPENMKTFQVDAKTLREQMAKAGAAAAGAGEEARRAGDVLQADPDAAIEIKRRKGLARFIIPVFKILGLAVGLSLVVIAILFVVSLLSSQS